MNYQSELNIASLYYTLLVSDTVAYDNPPDVEFTTNEAKFILSEGKLKCEMLTHFSNAYEARAAVEPLIRAWEAVSKPKFDTWKIF